MDLILFGSIIIVLLLLFEISKHVFFKSFSKTILMILLVFIVFFVIVSTLESEKAIETDNPIIQTGAAIVDSIKDQEFVGGIKEGFEDIKESASDSFN